MPYFLYQPYVSVAERRRLAEREIARRTKKGGFSADPVHRISGRHIARTFWGKAWCDHLEAYSDFENRLPRGRTYVRNGSVVHLAVTEGKVVALVQGTSLYEIEVGIASLPKTRWKRVVSGCSGQIDSLVGLLKGELSDAVMRVVTDRDHGLFPAPAEIELSCSCPDSAKLCKHLAAVLYGVGARLDERPELLFLLRGVDQGDLLSAGAEARPEKGKGKKKRKVIAKSDLEDVFGIDLDLGGGRRR